MFVIGLYYCSQAKLDFVRLPIEKIYHPFICGPGNEYVKGLIQQTGVRIVVPPPSVHEDEIVVSGEKEGVHTCIQAINAIYEEKVRSTPMIYGHVTMGIFWASF